MTKYEKEIIGNPLSYQRYFYYYPERYGGKDQTLHKDPWEIGVTCPLKNANFDKQITKDSKLVLRNLNVPMNVSVLPDEIQKTLKTEKGENDIVQGMKVKDFLTIGLVPAQVRQVRTFQTTNEENCELGIIKCGNVIFKSRFKESSIPHKVEKSPDAEAKKKYED